MNKDTYKKIVKKYTPKEKIIKDSVISFFVGGLLGVLFTFLTKLISSCFHLPTVDGISWTLIIFISCTGIITGIGVFDFLMLKCKSGLIVPITGFAHAVVSSAMDYRKDGFITGIGSNVFKLAGSVLLYGIVSAFVFALLKVILCLP